MRDSFYSHEEKFIEWKKSGYPNVLPKTLEFIENLFTENGNIKIWKHQIEGILRVIYSFEILGKKNLLLNIVTGGGKTAIIGAIIFWLKYAHSINKFLILTPNTIVRARLEVDFKSTEENIFKKFGFITEKNKSLTNTLDLYVMKSGEPPQGMLESGIILGNIQQLYPTADSNRNLAYLRKFVGDIAIFNDEAHNTPAPEYANILSLLSEKSRFRLDTTATPNRADGREPDSEMIYRYDVTAALNDGIIKSIIVYQPEVKLLKMTYVNPETGERRDVTELDVEFNEAEKNIKAFQWVLDEEPMRKQISIAKRRHIEQIALAKGRYKPILFVVAMSIREGEKVQKILQDIFKMNTLLVTEESSDNDREEALKLGKFESKYEAVVSVLMLREGWDVPEVSTILLLRKFSSEVYGQQVIGRGLRKIIKKSSQREVLSVVDHPRLEHDWLWKIVAVSKITQQIDESSAFNLESDLQKPIVQQLVHPDKIIKIPEPKYESEIDFNKLESEISNDQIENDWEAMLARKQYDKARWMITQTRVESIQSKELKTKRLVICDGVNEDDHEVSGELKRYVLENKFKNELLNTCAQILQEYGFGSMNRRKLYKIMLNHITNKIFSGKHLSNANRLDIEFAIYSLPDIKSNFTNSIVGGIVEGD
ncbi:MAG: DEAD/DEAH box helicase family protein [Gammaproteobacteria bacterium]|nr:DEAD/DEAH box helicase family protein [Gammaproteobacteria bacterium]